jgi:hypothetical protein
MKVKDLIGVLKKFSPDALVRVGVNWPDRVTEVHENVWVGTYGTGPQINAEMDLRGVRVHVGCVLQRHVKNMPERTISLGHYHSTAEAAKVRDFYIVHKRLDEPLNFPDFDYDKWIPPRTTSGEYNEHIAEILKEKLLKD